MGRRSSSAAFRVARRRSRLHVSTSRGARSPRTRPCTLPSTLRMNAIALSNSFTPAASSTHRLSLPLSSPPPGAGERAGPENGAKAEPVDLAEQRLLHAELAAELHERGDAVSQHL